MQSAEVNGPSSVGGLHWQLQGACRCGDRELFYAVEGEGRVARRMREQRARAICEGCAVSGPCLAYALKNDELFGMWGGKSETERRRLIARRCEFHAFFDAGP